MAADRVAHRTADQHEAAVGVAPAGAGRRLELALRGIGGHVALDVPHARRRIPAARRLVERQAARHPQKLIDGDRGPRVSRLLPLGHRHPKPRLWSLQDAGGQRLAQRPLEQVLGGPTAQLELRRQAGRPLHQPIIQERRARFERTGHGRDVNLGQQVVRQVRIQVHRQQRVQQPGAVAPIDRIGHQADSGQRAAKRTV